MDFITMKHQTGGDLDVFGVCCLQLLSEMRVRLQNLDHLSEIPVVVQPGVLQRADDGDDEDEDGDDDINTSELRTSETHSGLVLFGFRLHVIAIDGNRADPDPDCHEQQQRTGSQPHPPAWLDNSAGGDPKRRKIKR